MLSLSEQRESLTLTEEDKTLALPVRPSIKQHRHPQRYRGSTTVSFVQSVTPVQCRGKTIPSHPIPAPTILTSSSSSLASTLFLIEPADRQTSMESMMKTIQHAELGVWLQYNTSTVIGI
ncbi:hypothetical protein ACMFMG_000941 [Clarireedia jacksonii]